MKPMLAAKTDGKNLVYPVLASPKLDGVRALIIDGKVYSRKLKLIPNLFVQAMFGQEKYNGLDGELIVGEPNAEDAIRVTTSGVMSVEGQPDVYFHVFDCFSAEDGTSYLELPFDMRQRAVKLRTKKAKRIKVVPQTELFNEEELAGFEAGTLEDGFEGVMVRAPRGPYKQGRSTEREGWLLKLKRFEDSEAVILGCVEQMHNGNEATKDELGHTKRSTHKANKTGKGTLGALQVKDVKTGVEFDIGTGFDDALRADLWARRNSLKGQVVKYKFFPTGSKEKPRFPVFLAFRDRRDM